MHINSRLKFVTLVLVGALLLAVTTLAQADTSIPRGERPLPDSLGFNRLDTPATAEATNLSVLSPALWGVEGEEEVIIRLTTGSIAERGLVENAASRAKRSMEQDQAALIKRIQKLDPNAQVIAQVQVVLNAVFVKIDAAVLPQIANDPAVSRIAPVGNYELDLTETVPYIGGTAVQNTGFDGSGIKVAVLDSGIDYTHANLGGGGTLADYNAAYSDPTSRDGLFPTAKVVDGYDFVGEVWPNGPLLPDPDPIDFEGHGTHVADIIGGVNGVAPGVDLYAVKVCSAISSSCSGIALIQGMEFAVDPNGDGRPKDRVDIINMSLGSLYGQPFDDDLSTAVDNATALGVLTVASAGNSADKPFVTGSPAAAETALSVAQTQVPSAALQLITVNGNDYPGVFQPWSVPVSSTISGLVQYGDGAGGNLLGCAPFAPGSLTGLVVLVDRGACTFSAKISNISQAGGEAGIIGLVAPGAPFAGGDGGERPIDIPGFMISQADSNAIKAAITAGGANATIDPNNQLPLVGQMVGSSSRGPQFDDFRIKPEIGAPGASVSAVAGSGNGEGPFGGTSGAAPMVSGAAALVLDAYGGTKTTGNGTPPGNAVGHGLTPLMVKSLLMNNGETEIDTDPFTGRAPISRIGGGEVRVDRAVNAPIVAFDKEGFSGALSFGFVEVDDTVTLKRTVTIRNLDNSRRTYTVTPTFRYANDAANGAVTVSAPSSVTVKPGLGRETTFDVTLTIDGSLLRGNYMNSGSLGADPAGLTLNEYDGYLILNDGSHPIHLAWHVLPRKAANVAPERTTLDLSAGIDIIGLNNQGAGTAQNDAYSLLALSPNLPEGGRGQQAPTPDIRGVGINTFPVPAGFCSTQESFLWAFAINTWERQTHADIPGVFFIDLDTDMDGTPDYLVYNYDLAGLGSIADGRNVTWAAPYINYPTTIGASNAFFFTEHSVNTGNTVLLICGEQIGLTGSDMLTTNVGMSVEAVDIYFGGPGDLVDGLVVTPLGEQYAGFDPATFTLGVADIAGNSAGALGVVDFGPFPGNTPELGVMLFTNGDRGAGNRGGATADTEALFFLVP